MVIVGMIFHIAISCTRVLKDSFFSDKEGSNYAGHNVCAPLGGSREGKG